MADTDTPAWRRVASSMRARITLAAALVTAIAVATAGWLLIRSVRETQLEEITGEAQAQVDAVAARLEDGATWEDAIRDHLEVAIRDEDGSIIGLNPFPYQGPNGEIYQRMITSDDASVADGGGIAAPVPSDGAITGGAPEGSISMTAAAAPYSIAELIASGVLDSENVRMVYNDRQLEIVRANANSDRYGRVEVVAAGYVDEVARSVDAVRRALWVLLPGLVGVVALVA